MRGLILFRRGAFLALLLALGTILPTRFPAASGEPPDVGLVTRVAGEAVFTNPSEGGKTGRVQAFMKIRRGDRLTLPAGAGLTLVYFANSRKEVWQGPVEVTVQDDQGEGRNREGAAVQPQVDVLPTQ